MRSALICVFFALIAHKEGSRAIEVDDFRPTPIPLKDWRPEKEDTAGTLHETIKAETPLTVAAVPAHYWEDALRHSVYLTLVRDKIDQLIAKGVVVSPENQPNNGPAKEIDDHDLWEKIKRAPFDRLNDTASPGDVSILAKGRLVEEDNGFRFAEDKSFPGKCSDGNCTKAVKAFWSVKRVRQRDAEPSTGKYHYDLTFSVTSQTSKKMKKPFENPARTFTIRESAPTESPPIRRPYDSFHRQPTRPQRAIWVHKNIAPLHNYQVSQSNLDRIFTSIFSDEDSFEEESHRYKPNTYVPQMYPQYSKPGYIGNRETWHHQKKMMPFSPTTQSYKYSPPVLQPHATPSYIQNPYLVLDQFPNGPHIQYMKTTRPPVLPTPVTPDILSKDSTVDATVKTQLNITETPEAINTYKMYKPKQPATKITYPPEMVRPPVYSAPPGVFVTMDKKPFKPLPPLKQMHTPKPFKGRPLDFRPSPQVIENQFSDTDSVPDTAFRPITINTNTDLYNKDTTDDNKNNNKDIRKPNNSKKPIRKQERIKPQQTTTNTPEIITAQDDDNDMEWATLLGAFSKTTPMASQKEKTTTTTESSVDVTTATVASVTTIQTTKQTDTYNTTIPTPIVTTHKSKKRTRPPPKFKKEKVIKHKRVSSTTSSTTTTKLPPKDTVTKATEDLTPQASSAPVSNINSVWETKNKTGTVDLTTSTYTTETITVTQPTTTTSYLTSSTTTVTPPTPVTKPPRSKNRFRQSTLMHKGTSINHDKWSSPTMDKIRTTPSITNKFSKRRTASKFNGYMSSTTPGVMDAEINTEGHGDHTFNSEISSTDSPKENEINTFTPSSLQNSIQENAGSKDTISEPTYTQTQAGVSTDVVTIETDRDNVSNDASIDDGEFIFPTKPTTAESKSTDNFSYNTSTMESTTVTSQHLATKNKPKCKKKNQNKDASTENILKTSTEAFNIKTDSTTERVTTPDILEELFASFTADERDKEDTTTSTLSSDIGSEGSESINRNSFILDETVERFLESLEEKGNQSDDDDQEAGSSEEVLDYNEKSNIHYLESPFDNSEENSQSRAHYEDYYDDDDESQDSQPFNLLELMAME